MTTLPIKHEVGPRRYSVQIAIAARQVLEEPRRGTYSTEYIRRVKASQCRLVP